MTYLAVKALHILGMVIWMAGMIFVSVVFRAYAPERPPAEVAQKLARSFGYLCTPAMIVVWTAGLFVASSGGWLSSGWMQAKLAGVIILSGLHGAMVGQLRRAGRLEGSPKALAVMQFPVIGLVLVAILLAVFRPF
jgi:uncharacterized membrane protein